MAEFYQALQSYKLLGDFGSIVISLLTVAWLWLHVRDQRVTDLQIAQHIAELRLSMTSSREHWEKQTQANAMSAVADRNILEQLAATKVQIVTLERELKDLTELAIRLETVVREVLLPDTPRPPRGR